MNKLMIASVLTMGVVVAQPAMADYDTVGSAVVGSLAGAVIGHAVGGRNGAAVGAAIGGVSGAVIGSNSRGYYSGGYYEREPVAYRPAPVYERTQVVYAQPQPVYYAQPVRQVYVQPVVYERESYGYGFRHGWHHGWDRDRGYDRDNDRGEHAFNGYGRY
jgi:uncharacterized protein YcfJ